MYLMMACPCGPRVMKSFVEIANEQKVVDIWVDLLMFVTDYRQSNQVGIASEMVT